MKRLLLASSALLWAGAAHAQTTKPWTLEDLPNAPAMELYRANDTTLQTSSAGAVSAIAQEAVDGGGGRGAVLTQSTPSAQPVYSATANGFGGLTFTGAQSLTHGTEYQARGSNRFMLFTGYLDYTQASGTQPNVFYINGNGYNQSQRQPLFNVNKSAAGGCAAGSFQFGFGTTYVCTAGGVAAAGQHVVVGYFDAGSHLCIATSPTNGVCSASPVVVPLAAAGVSGSLGGNGQPFALTTLAIGEDTLTPDLLQRIFYVEGKQVGLTFSDETYSDANPPMIAVSATPIAARGTPTQPDPWHHDYISHHYVVSGPGSKGGALGSVHPGVSLEPGLYTAVATDATHFTVTSPLGENLGTATYGVTFSNPQVSFEIGSQGPYTAGDTFVFWPCLCQATGTQGTSITDSTMYPSVYSWPISGESLLASATPSGQDCTADVLQEGQYCTPSNNPDGTPRVQFRSPVYTGVGASETFTTPACVAGQSDANGPYLDLQVQYIGGAGANRWNACNIMTMDASGLGFGQSWGYVGFEFAITDAMASGDVGMDRYIGSYDFNTYQAPSWKNHIEHDWMEVTTTGSGPTTNWSDTMHDHGPVNIVPGLGDYIAGALGATSTVGINVTSSPWSSTWTQGKINDSLPHWLEAVEDKDNKKECVFADHLLIGCITIPQDNWGAIMNMLMGIETGNNAGTATTPAVTHYKLYKFIARRNPAWN